ncbi:MAG TPA: hypothetical protein VKX39_15135 [Bryobacteraceae bacterium]|nr:hypothetical protein [Bryobacteraceae bacterium]
MTAVLGGAASAQSSVLSDQLTTITQQLQQLQTINQTQIETMEQNTEAVAQNTSEKGQGGSNAKSVGSTLESVLGFGLGLSPLISGLMSLFGGGGSSETAPLVPYIAPATVNATLGIGSSQAGVFAVNEGSGGLPNPVPAQSTQITVQVQALDSQSFLDHSDDIAQAVRQAMLTSTTLNDVVRAV